MTETIALNAYELANLADCGTPDEPGPFGFVDADTVGTQPEASPGARFLLGVWSAVAEAIDNYTDGSTDDQRSEDAHEIADSAVPIYTHELWATFVDLAAYQEDVTEYVSSTRTDGYDMQRLASVALYMIAERLALALLESAGEGS